jgi:uncharacterized membrane protein SpoIIM required for sporulation
VNEVLFVEQREPDWKRLKFLADKADSSPVRLSPDELEELMRLYRRVSGDLSKVRTVSANTDLIHFLNDLCARAYGVLYRAPRFKFGRALAGGIVAAARTARRRWVSLAVSACLFLGSAAFAFLALTYAPETKAHFVPEEWSDTFRSWREGQMEERSLGESLGMTGFYMGNNPRAAIATGAISASTFGVGSAALVFFNGALLGALVHELAPVGRVGYLLAQVMPHGVTELTGLVFSGASGFVMAAALLRPGQRTRGQALKEAAKDALVLLLTAIAMMFLAAPIEGFFSFQPSVPIWAKVAFAILSAIAWAAFWIGYGREKPSAPDVTS